MAELKNKTQRYQAYKDSGVEWLGEVPEHWKVKKFKFVLDQSKGLTITKQNLINEGVFCVNYGEIHSKFGFELDTNKNKLKCVDEEYLTTDSNSLLNKGDFVFADTSEDIEGSGNFTHLRSDDKTFAGYHTVIARPKIEIKSLFLAFVFDSISFRNQIRKKVKGVKVYSITQTVLKETTIWFPPLQEQTKIAEFLDDKTTKIDQAIAIKEQQIGLLKERKQILIHKGVTQGVNPNVKLKKSDVTWIGEIPEHWEVKKAKYLFNEIDERSINGTEELLSVSHMTGVTPRSEKNVSMFKSEDYSGSKLCKKNDLVFNIMWAWMGALGISDRVGIVSPSYAIYRQKITDTFNEYYLEALLGTENYISHYNKVSTGLHSSRLRFYSRMFFDMKIGFPTKKEQDKIVDHIKEVSNKIEIAINLKQQEIAKLKEYKSSLINSVVTGKVKMC